MKNDNFEVQSYMGFLSEDLTYNLEPIPQATLDAVRAIEQPIASSSGANIVQSSNPSGLGRAISLSKRASGCDISPISDSEDEDKTDDKNSSKRIRTDTSVAATRKASREKARREKLNERFNSLSKLIDPAGEPKSDKTTILADAIKFVQQMTVENHQLKQLNKFLEERVSSHERERGHQLYQRSLSSNVLQPSLSSQQGSLLSHRFHNQPCLPGPSQQMLGNSSQMGLGLDASLHYELQQQQAYLLNSNHLPVGVPEPLSFSREQRHFAAQQAAVSKSLDRSESLSGTLMGSGLAASRSNYYGNSFGHIPTPTSPASHLSSTSMQRLQSNSNAGSLQRNGSFGREFPGLAGSVAADTNRRMLASATTLQAKLAKERLLEGNSMGLSRLDSSSCLTSLGMNSASSGGMGGHADSAGTSLPGGLPGVDAQNPGLYWNVLPQHLLDSSQDSLLRPPAA